MHSSSQQPRQPTAIKQLRWDSAISQASEMCSYDSYETHSQQKRAQNTSVKICTFAFIIFLCDFSIFRFMATKLELFSTCQQSHFNENGTKPLTLAGQCKSVPLLFTENIGVKQVKRTKNDIWH